MRKILYIIFILTILQSAINSSGRIPLIIKSKDKTFKDISEDIQKNLPKNIEILIYKLNLLNGTEELQEDINRHFFLSISILHTIHEYSILLESEIKDKYPETQDMDFSFIKNQDELELIGFGKILEQDAVLISSITILEGKTKKIWDSKKKKYEQKNIALFQGIIFNTDTGTSIHRFSYYFYLDQE